MAQALIDDIVIPQDVQEFCTSHGLAGDLQTSVTLAREVFAPSSRVVVTLEGDPETGEEYIVVQVDVTMAVDEALRRNRGYTSRWIQAASEKGRENIRFLFSIP